MLKIRVEMNERETKHNRKDQQSQIWLLKSLLKLIVLWFLRRCNAGLEETQAGIKTAGRNINNLRYADDTTLMAERKEELKSLLMKVKEEE